MVGKTVRRGKARKQQGAPGVANASPSKGAHVPRLSMGADTLLGLAQTQRRTLSISGNFGMSSVAGAYAETVIPMNDCFSAFGGTSATGYSKYMAFYTRCFVLGSRVIVKSVYQPGTTTSAATVGVAVSSLASSFASANSAIEAGMCQWDEVGNTPDRLHYTVSVEVSKFLNVPVVLSNPALASTSAASPTTLIDAHLFIDNAAATTGTLITQFETLFDVVFTDPIPFT